MHRDLSQIMAYITGHSRKLQPADNARPEATLGAHHVPW